MLCFEELWNLERNFDGDISDKKFFIMDVLFLFEDFVNVEDVELLMLYDVCVNF